MNQVNLATNARKTVLFTNENDVLVPHLS